MRIHSRPGPPPARLHLRPRRPVRSARLISGVLLVGVLATGCASVTAGQATPAAGGATASSGGATAAGAPVDDALGAGATPSAGGRSTAATTARPTPSSSTGSTTGRPGSEGSSAATSTALPSAAPPSPAPSSATGAPAAGDPVAWLVVPPAGLQAWQAVPADDVSQIWRSGNCLVVVSAPADVPDMTDERFARAHVRYAVNQWIAQVDPSTTESGDYLTQETDPLRVSDPTRTEPPAVHLQLSGFRNDFPAIGVTDQTYSFVTQGGGQGLVVSTVCSQGEFASRYDPEIAPLVADLGVDTGI